MQAASGRCYRGMRSIARASPSLPETPHATACPAPDRQSASAVSSSDSATVTYNSALMRAGVTETLMCAHTRAQHTAHDTLHTVHANSTQHTHTAHAHSTRYTARDTRHVARGTRHVAHGTRHTADADGTWHTGWKSGGRRTDRKSCFHLPKAP
eukprot:735814-Rhodomonas_salina.2